jgi:hypothetical protein
MSVRKLGIILAATFAAALVVPVAADAQTSAPAPIAAPSLSQIPVSGIAHNGKHFTGHYNVTQFVTRNGKTYAVGTLVGRLGGRHISRSNVAIPASVHQSTVPGMAKSAAVTCPILHLVLGPLNLNLLGLNEPQPGGARHHRGARGRQSAGQPPVLGLEPVERDPAVIAGPLGAAEHRQPAIRRQASRSHTAAMPLLDNFLNLTSILAGIGASLGRGARRAEAWAFLPRRDRYRGKDDLTAWTLLCDQVERVEDREQSEQDKEAAQVRPAPATVRR